MKKTFYTILVCLAILSLSLIYVGESNNHPLASSFGFSILTSVIVSFAFEFFLAEYQKKDNEDLKNRIISSIDRVVTEENLIKDIQGINIQKIYSDRVWMYNNFEKVALLAKERILILGESLSGIIAKDESRDALIMQLHNAVEVNVLLMDPYSNAASARAEELHIDYAQSMGPNLKAIKQFEDLKKYGKFKIKYFDIHPKLFIVIIDDNIVFAQPYSFGYGGTEAPMLRYEGKNSKNVKLYQNIFFNVWRLSHESLNANPLISSEVSQEIVSERTPVVKTHVGGDIYFWGGS